jgi:hypothetical protein
MFKESRIAAYIVTCILLFALIAGTILLTRTYSARRVASFQECKDAGYPIMETFPEQCLAEGKVFINSQ